MVLDDATLSQEGPYSIRCLVILGEAGGMRRLVVLGKAALMQQ